VKHVDPTPSRSIGHARRQPLKRVQSASASLGVLVSMAILAALLFFRFRSGA